MITGPGLNTASDTLQTVTPTVDVQSWVRILSASDFVRIVEAAPSTGGDTQDGEIVRITVWVGWGEKDVASVGYT